MNPTPAPQALISASTHYSQRRYPEALSSCRQVLKQHPELTQAYQLLGDILMALQKPQASIDAYQLALRIDPHYPGCEVAHFRLAEALKNSGQPSEALQYYTDAMLANPQWVTDDLLVSGESSAIQYLIPSGAIVFDIGAQIGRWTQTVLAAVPNAQLYLFEPVQDNHQHLQKLITAKPPQATLRIEKLAVGRQREQRTFYNYHDSSEWGSLYRRSEGIEQQYGMTTPTESLLETVSLDEYCGELNISKIDFLKIDTEGGELDILKGARGLLQSQKIGVIQFEYGGCWSDSNIKLETAFNWLNQLGYQLFKILPTGLLKLEKFTANLENYQWCNFLAVSPNLTLSGLWSMLTVDGQNYPFINWAEVKLALGIQQRSPTSPISNFGGSVTSQLEKPASDLQHANLSPLLFALDQVAESQPELSQNPNWSRYRNDFSVYLNAYQSTNEATEFPKFTFYPCLDDNVSATPIDPYYFYQDTWAARKVFEHRPKSLVDVGSTVLYAGIVSQIVPTKFVDIRPPDLKIPGFEVVSGSILDLPFPNESQEFVTSLCVVEHIGLGRYGDPIIPDGTRQACSELDRILAPGGSLIISVPVGPPCIAFNAHRIFSKEQFLAYFPSYKVIDDIHLTPQPMGAEIIPHIPIGDFIVWVAHLQKPTSNSSPPISRTFLQSEVLEVHDEFTQQQLFLQQFIKLGDLVFDIGTNLGQKADIYLALRARVICFEPNPDLVVMLHEKYRELDQVRIVNRGIAQTNGQLQLNVCSKATTISTFSQAWQQGRFANDHQWDRQVTVETMTLDQAIAQHGLPSFCKIDVEGFEYEVLSGLSHTISTICFEFAFELIENTEQCLEKLHQLGYRQFNFSSGSKASFAFSRWLDRTELINRLRSLAQSDSLLWGDIYAQHHLSS